MAGYCFPVFGDFHSTAVHDEGALVLMVYDSVSS